MNYNSLESGPVKVHKLLCLDHFEEISENLCIDSQTEIRHTKWVKCSGAEYKVGLSPSWELELRPLGVATGNALSVTRSEDTYEKTPPVGRRQPMTSLPAYHNISAAGRIHHQLFRLH